ncbi:hypothetical protein B0H19DRAFT_1294882 [Mycena capillaripes]|nr:hypothetical protein B0H19DRAFT_1294882 [Mycena capillaripes]
MGQTIAQYPAAYETLRRGDPIKCATTGTVFPAVPAPAAVILDVFAMPQLQATRSISGTIPIFAFICTYAGALIRMFCPEELGGRGDFWAKVDSEALRSGGEADKLAEQMWKQTDGTVVEIPGVPAMCDYEHFPQVRRCVIMACDGIFSGTAPAYDGKSLVAFEAWVRETLHKSIYAVGPLLPPGYGAEQTPTSNNPRDAGVKSFLEAMRSKFGNKSMLFISFGTIFWPKVQEQLEDLIDALVEKQFPFLLCHAAPSAILSDSLSQKIKASGIGMAAAWAPQQFILTHPVTGWFLAHCGHGGITESLASGVPMICWPFEGDQPIAAMHLSQTLNVAFHLMEVRTSKGLQPLHGGYVPKGTRDAIRAEFRVVIDECRGEKGHEKRRNAERMREELASAWAVGGWASVALNQFSAEYFSTQ